MKTLPLVVMLASTVVGADYRIAPGDGSYVRLEVEKTGLLRGKTHVFAFSRFQGNVTYTDVSAASSKVNLAMEAASIRCQDRWLKAKDLVKVQQYAEQEMLAIDRYKTLSFRSASVVAQGPSALQITGALTIRDVTRPVQVIVNLRPDGNGYTAEGTSPVKLTGFKLKPPSAALGTIGTKDEMRLTFWVKLTRSGQ